MKRFIGRVPRSASTVVAVLVVLFVVGGFFLVFGIGGEGTGVLRPTATSGVSDSTLRALTLGTSRKEVERRVGEGWNALKYQETGAAVEPIDADCVYFPQAGIRNVRDIVQLCFRDGQLASKRKFAATPGAPLLP